MCAFLKKRSGACRAGIVHRIVHGHTVAQADEFGILPSNLKNGGDLRIVMSRSGGVCGNLVIDMRCSKVGTSQFARRAGCCNQGHLQIAMLRSQTSEAFSKC